MQVTDFKVIEKYTVLLKYLPLTDFWNFLIANLSHLNDSDRSLTHTLAHLFKVYYSTRITQVNTKFTVL